MACMTSRVLMMSKVHACVCWHVAVNDALCHWSGVKGEYAWHVCRSMGACLWEKSLSNTQVKINFYFRDYNYYN